LTIVGYAAGPQHYEYLVFNPFRKAGIDSQFRKPRWWNKLDIERRILGVC
jgi:hypothetical protein